MKNWWLFEPEWWYSYDLNVKPLDLWKWWPDNWWRETNIDLSLLGTPEANDYGTHLYDDSSLIIWKTIVEETPDFAFTPDDWNKVIQTWAYNYNIKYGLEWKNCFEVWVWTAINVIYILMNFNVLKINWSDIEAKVVELAQYNVNKYWKNPEKFRWYVSNLLKDLSWDVKSQIQFLIACIPQAYEVAWDMDIPDKVAHVYPKKLFKHNKYNDKWLGLNGTLVEEASQARIPHIMLNIAWRVWENTWIEMFENYWYSPEIMYKERIIQCPTTSLRCFEDIEQKTGDECVFYPDKTWKGTIGAYEAEYRRRHKKEVYHDLSAILGIHQSVLQVNQ